MHTRACLQIDRIDRRHKRSTTFVGDNQQMQYLVAHLKANRVPNRVRRAATERYVRH
jgi:hypothetical protein